MFKQRTLLDAMLNSLCPQVRALLHSVFEYVSSFYVDL